MEKTSFSTSSARMLVHETNGSMTLGTGRELTIQVLLDDSVRPRDTYIQGNAFGPIVVQRVATARFTISPVHKRLI
eukprot:8308844-Karenia_brevis.AAC.1